MASAYFNQDKELAEFFTDVEHLREAFRTSVAAPMLTRRLLVIHGVGGVGKSSLLRMFRLHCKSINTPVALASGDEEKSALDVLARWTEDLKGNGIAFPSFGKTFDHYRAIQAKVDEQAKRAQDARSRAVDIAGKAASKTAEAAGGALAGAAIGSVIPGVGTAIGGALGGVLGGMGTEALVDWLRGFLAKPDIDLILDPAKKLIDDLLIDIAPVAAKQRLVLMLDTLEQMTSLDDWARDVAQRMPANVFVVIAGRALPNWSREWQGWMASAQVEELKPMTEDVMRELIQRYYATMRGGEPDPAQVEAIIRFARGLPMVVTSAVQLWVKYGVEDFQSVKAEIVANLVDRLMEGVPKGLIPALEAAAVVRWFDQPILRAVTGLADVREVYNELRRFPFVRTRAEGLALHDAVREIMDENLRVQDSERHCELHERAVAYFEKRLEREEGEEAQRLQLERLYHHIRADEKDGIKLFRAMAEELGRYRLVNYLRVLLNDVNTYPLERENSNLWRKYYAGILALLDFRYDDAKQVMREIAAVNNIEDRLQAYALSDLASIATEDQVFRPGGLSEILDYVGRSNMQLVESDPKRIRNLAVLGKAYHRVGKMDSALDYFQQAVDGYEKIGDKYSAANAFGSMRDTYAILGDWRHMFESKQRGLEVLPRVLSSSAIYSNLLSIWAVAWAWAGRYLEPEQDLRESLSINRQLGVATLSPVLMDLGYCLGMQDKFTESEECFTQAISQDYSLQNQWSAGSYSYWARTLLRKGDLQRADEYMRIGWKMTLESKKERFYPVQLFGFGQLEEYREHLDQAEKWYRESLRFPEMNRHYFECAALTGLVRVKHAQGDYAAISPLLADMGQLARQYEYNDHLASVRLTQGHIAWEGKAPSWDNGYNAAMHLYKQALTYALRYNRYLLDEVLSGRPQGTPLRPIIPYSLEHGEEGRRMLLALRDWWETGVNDIGTPRPDTISPIREGITLLEAERIAREREPGDGTPQKSVVNQIEAALA